MHISEITELYSSSQFSESLILRQVNSNGRSYLLARKIRKGMGYSTLWGHKSIAIATGRRLIGSHRKGSVSARAS